MPAARPSDMFVGMSDRGVWPRAWLAGWTVVVLGVPAGAQTSAPAPPALFDSPEPLEFTLTTNLKAVDKDRGTDRHYHPAVLSFSGPDHAPATLNIRVITRGIFRLKPILVTSVSSEQKHSHGAAQCSTISLTSL